MSFDTRPIGVFDSGVGGLTVVDALHSLMPHEKILYLGDTARVPYGNRGPDTIRRYALNAAHFLISQGVKAVVVACNTASAYALDILRETWDLPIFGVIDPVAAASVRHSTTSPGTVVVLATRATVQSEVYPLRIRSLLPNLNVIQQACPLLVPLAEEGWHSGIIVEQVVDVYLQELYASSGSFLQNATSVILGCTHYPLLKVPISAVFKSYTKVPVKLFDSANIAALDVKSRLAQDSLLTDSILPGSIHLFATDQPDAFVRTAQRIFHRNLDTVEHVDLLDLG